MKTQELSWFNQFRTPQKHTEIYSSDAVSLPFVPLQRAGALCGWCRHDQQQDVITSAEKRTGQISKPLSRLRDGAQKDCWVCKALLNSTQLWREVDQSDFERIVAISIRYDVERCIIGAGSKLPKIQLFSPPDCPNVFRFSPDNELPSQPSSAQTLNFITYNLNSCLHNHKACQKYQTEMASRINGNWPSRILEIDAKTRTIRLVKFNPAAHSRYVALSYCWGNQKGQLTSNKSSLPRLVAGISVAKLPGTLKDAVTVTTRLGLKHIWIDSICIIQDDPNDWKQEAGKMSTVYAQSLVTIIASSANSCSEGFLSQKRAPSTEVASIRVQGREAEIRARIIYDWGHHRGGPQADENARLRWMDPVDSRAWTLQERVLSGRYINFTSGEVQWGCVSCKDCECGQALYGNLYEPLSDTDKWFRLVEEYCTRRITKETDKLVAIAGMARAMETVLREQWYVAGLWLSTTWTPLTLKSFMWRRMIYSPLTAVSSQYIAPSFSWASHRGQPSHVDEATFSGCTFPSSIVGLNPQYSSPDTFGGLNGAFLRVRGPLVPAKLKWDNTITQADLKVSIKVERSDKDYYGGCRVDGLLESVRLRDGRNAVRRRADDSVAPEQAFEGVDVYLLPIAVRKLGTFFKSKDYSAEHEADCLVLAQSLQFPGFERLGAFTKSRWDKKSSTPCIELDIY